MKNFLFIIFLMFTHILLSQQNNNPILIIRCDDLGMCHSVNMAAKKLIDTGLPISFSIMFPCAWYQEALDIVKDKQNVSLGIHLTLNSEWKNYKWGPVAGAMAVPSLVDSCGYFFPSRKTFNDNNPKFEEIEIELRAQIERAMKSGLKFDYLDYHMGTAVEKPESRAIVEKLAAEYGLGISRYFGEIDIKNVYSSAPVNKSDDLLKNVLDCKKNEISLLVCHIGLDTDEMRAMEDLNPTGLKEMSKHREAELNALLNYDFKKVISENDIQLINYKQLISLKGLNSMKTPK